MVTDPYYNIVSSSSDAVLNVVYYDNEGEAEISDNHLKIYKLTLMLNDENVILSYYSNSEEGDNNYEVTLESSTPIITRENISQFKEINGVDEKYLNIQDKFISNKNISTKDIEALWGREFEDDFEKFNMILDTDEGEKSISCIQVDEDGDRVVISLNNDTVLSSASMWSSELYYSYTAKDSIEGIYHTIKDDKYEAKLSAVDKDSLIANVEKLYALKIK